MKISFLGGAKTVTGSRHLIELNNNKILLDCGLFQGRRKEAESRNRNFRFDVTSIDAMILSHAHIDHSGNIPGLIKMGYTGPIYATSATTDLCKMMLPDSGHIQEKDVEYLNRKRRKKNQLPLIPLYTQQDAINSLQNFEKISYNTDFHSQ